MSVGKAERVLCFLAPLLLATASFPQTASDSSSWEDRSFRDTTYEDRYTFKHKKTFFLDTYTWAYSADFAKRFRMPGDWIDPELHGALAVAWRMTNIGSTTCGLGGRAENCWPPLTCQMDIYFDSATPLPWRYNDVMRDNFMRGVSSADFLPWLSRESPSLRYLEPGSKGPPLRKGAFNYVGSATTTSGFFLAYFDRAFEPGMTLVGFTEACPRAGLDGAAQLKFFSEEEYKRTRGAIQNYAHTVTFSRRFMKTIADKYETQNKPNEDITRRLIQDFFNSKKTDPNFSPRQ